MQHIKEVKNNLKTNKFISSELTMQYRHVSWPYKVHS